MTFGFQIFKANGQLQISSQDIGGLFFDTLNVGPNATVSVFIPQVTAANVSVVASKSSSAGSTGVSVSTTDVTGGVQIVVTTESGVTADAEIIIE
jgi:hypothetical protein